MLKMVKSGVFLRPHDIAPDVKTTHGEFNNT